MHDLTDKVALITGIGSASPDGWGNGTTIATVFARQGAKIFGCDIRPELGATGVAQIQSHTPSADVTCIEADVTNADSAKALVDACMARHGRIDILVNNVGKSEPGGPAEMAEEVWDAQVDVNLKSVYLMTHLVLPIMASQTSGGNVVCISSVAGLRYIGKPQVAYAATKAAIIQFCKATAVLYAQRHAQGGPLIRLNTVIPGLIDTPLVRVLANKYAGGDYEGFRTTRDKQVPVGKMGTAWDVANAALFFASNEAAYVTGQELVIDGGLIDSTGRT
jgi:NAD(P)-dependent dehydrogenase (short-subunit alcohol dehydrogenase family)